MSGLSGLSGLSGEPAVFGRDRKTRLDDVFITNRVTYEEWSIRNGSTGDFDRWITDRIAFSTYVRR
jgi:hypothetical protein